LFVYFDADSGAYLLSAFHITLSSPRRPPPPPIFQLPPLRITMPDAITPLFRFCRYAILTPADFIRAFFQVSLSFFFR